MVAAQWANRSMTNPCYSSSGFDDSGDTHVDADYILFLCVLIKMLYDSLTPAVSLQM